MVTEKGAYVVDEAIKQRLTACEARIKRLEDKMERNAEITTELRTEMRGIKADIGEIKTALQEKLPNANDQIKFLQKLILIFVAIFATALGAALGFKTLMKLPIL